MIFLFYMPQCLWKYYHEELPTIFNNLFTPVKDLRNYNMRFTLEAVVFFAKKQELIFAFLI